MEPNDLLWYSQDHSTGFHCELDKFIAQPHILLF